MLANSQKQAPVIFSFGREKPADEAREHSVGVAIKSFLSINLQELPFGTSERIISATETFCHNRVSLCPNHVLP